jgi:hypothetical protein
MSAPRFLGPGATLSVGTAANNLVKLDASAKLPAVDGSQLTNLPGGAGDMLKSTYDPQNTGKISGGASGLGQGGILSMVGGAGSAAGLITTDGGAAGSGGSINTSGDATVSGGNINTYGSGLPGGSINTSVGGGSIDTTGVGNIQFGSSGTRTTLTGTASVDHALQLPNKDGILATVAEIPAADTGWVANASAGDKTVSVADYDSTTLDNMTAGLNLVLAGFGTAIAALADQVEALTKKLQAMEAAHAANLLENV